jgi:hypothetical protein
MAWPAIGLALQIGCVAPPFPSPFGCRVPQLGDSYPGVGQAVEPPVEPPVERKEWRLGDLALVANQAHSAAAAVDRRLAAAGGPTPVGWSPQTVTWPNLVPNGHPVAETFLPISAGFRAAAGESTGAGSVFARPKAQPVAAQVGGRKQGSPQIAIGATAFVHAGLVLLVLLQLAHQLVATHSRDRQPTEQREYSLQAWLATLATPQPTLGSSRRSPGFLQENQATLHALALQQQAWNPHGVTRKQYPFGAVTQDRRATEQDVVVPIVPVLHYVAPHSPAQPCAAAKKPLALGYLRRGVPLLVLAKAQKLLQQEQSELMAPMLARSARSPTR